MSREDTATVERNELQPELMSIMKEEVGKAKESRVPIIRAFEAVARRSGLKANTIRNYYYRYLHEKEEKTPAGRGNLGSQPGLEDAVGRPFSDAETKALMREMLTAQGRGESVRGCANRLGDGSKRMLIRYQNKYRSIIAREPEYVESIIRELEQEGIAAYNPYIRKAAAKAGRRPAMSSVENSGGQLIDWTGRFISNIQKTQLVSLQNLIKGLADLSGLAVENQSQDRRLENYNQKIQELNNCIYSLELKLNQERSAGQQLRHRLYEIMEVNRGYMKLSDEDKLSGLNDYLSRLQSCMMV